MDKMESCFVRNAFVVCQFDDECQAGWKEDGENGMKFTQTTEKTILVLMLSTCVCVSACSWDGFCSSYTFIYWGRVGGRSIITDDLFISENTSERWKMRENISHVLRMNWMRQSHVRRAIREKARRRERANEWEKESEYTWKQSTKYRLTDSIWFVYFVFWHSFPPAMLSLRLAPNQKRIYRIGNFTAGRDKLSWFECNYVCTYKICEIPVNQMSDCVYVILTSFTSSSPISLQHRSVHCLI